ncbi:MAG: hypothetical protein V1715_14090 [bacterium]
MKKLMNPGFLTSIFSMLSGIDPIFLTISSAIAIGARFSGFARTIAIFDVK